MEASKLILTPETKAYYSNPIALSKSRKRAMKLASIVAYLDKHDNIAKTSDLARVAGYYSKIDDKKALQAGVAFISHLTKTGFLKRENYKGYQKRWTVLKVEPVGPKPVVETVKVKVLDIKLIQEKAKEFYWAKKSDSLHDFIESLREEDQSNG